MVASILAAFRQMIERAHEHEIKMIGATIMPYGASGYYHPDAANEADREAINSWIRSAGHFDAVIDFDALMRDPKQPSRLRKEYDLGDGLHPSAAGYQAMGEAVPLSLFSGGRR
jgi:lysophospholipase L1-like esterase